MTDSTLASSPTESTHQVGTWLKAKKLGSFQKCWMEEEITEEKENLIRPDKLMAQARVGIQQKKESCSGKHPGFPLGLFSKTHLHPPLERPVPTGRALALTHLNHLNWMAQGHVQHSYSNIQAKLNLSPDRKHYLHFQILFLYVMFKIKKKRKLSV